MLNPIEIIKMQNEAKKLQNKMRERKIKGESKNGLICIYMNGAQEFEDIHIDEQYLELGMDKEIKNGFLRCAAVRPIPFRLPAHSSQTLFLRSACIQRSWE